MLRAQPGHRQRLPMESAGTAASASGLIAVPAHQQVSAGRPAITAHWLSCPHTGQVFSHCAGAVICRLCPAGLHRAIIAD